MKTLTHEDVLNLIEEQLSVWHDAKQRYDALMQVRRRPMTVGNIEIGIQCNPARIVSTGAKIDSRSVGERPCFLCSSNRPKEQIAYPIADGWDLLVNPFPIFPVHFTIASREHRPQNGVPDDIVFMAESMPGMAVFYNGAKAGASAPDHLHLQAVLKDELPLLRWVETNHSPEVSEVRTSGQLDAGLPYLFLSGVVRNDDAGPAVLKAGLMAGGPDADGRFTDQDKVNTFFWTDRTGTMRWVAVPRRAHRPSCYTADGPGNRMVSPGCVDMAGLVITPRVADYEVITVDDIEGILHDVAFPADMI